LSPCWLPPSNSGALRTDAQLAEREVAVDIRLSRQAEHPLADDVALDLAGAAGDGEHRREEQRGGGSAARRIVGVPGLTGCTGDRHPEIGAALPEQRRREFRNGTLRPRRVSGDGRGADPLADQRKDPLTRVDVDELLPDDWVVGDAEPPGQLEQGPEAGTAQLLRTAAG